MARMRAIASAVGICRFWSGGTANQYTRWPREDPDAMSHSSSKRLIALFARDSVPSAAQRFFRQVNDSSLEGIVVLPQRRP